MSIKKLKFVLPELILTLTKTFEKKIDQIYHNHLIKDFIGIENIVLKYLND